MKTKILVVTLNKADNETFRLVLGFWIPPMFLVKRYETYKTQENIKFPPEIPEGERAHTEGSSTNIRFEKQLHDFSMGKRTSSAPAGKYF